MSETSDDWEFVAEPEEPVYEVIEDLAPPLAAAVEEPAPAPLLSFVVAGPDGSRRGWLVQETVGPPSVLSVCESFAVWDFGEVPPGVHCGGRGTFGGLATLAGHQYQAGRDRLRGRPQNSAARYNPEEAAYVWLLQETEGNHRAIIPRFFLWNKMQLPHQSR